MATLDNVNGLNPNQVRGDRRRRGEETPARVLDRARVFLPRRHARTSRENRAPPRASAKSTLSEDGSCARDALRCGCFFPTDFERDFERARANAL
jgi:hypothetical protein